jgi:pilus assembly protein Flp/PilA
MLCQFRKSLVRFLKSEDGPTAVEYAIMLALVILVCFVAIQVLGTNTNSAYNTIGKSLGKAVAAT